MAAVLRRLAPRRPLSGITRLDEGNRLGRQYLCCRHLPAQPAYIIHRQQLNVADVPGATSGDPIAVALLPAVAIKQFKSTEFPF